MSNKKLIAVWGTGYIGLSTLMYFADKGVHGIGVDIDKDKVEAINKGICPIPNLEEWTGLKLQGLIDEGLINATTNWESVVNSSIDAHFISVNTEMRGEPWLAALKDVVQKISKADDPLVIVESTLVPGIMDQEVLPYIKRATVATRRDWFTFHFSDKNLGNLPRIVGGPTPEITKEVIDILSIVCNKVIEASSHRTSELTKAVENSQRHVGAVVAQQLADAYPDIDMNEVFKLAATKWNVEEYYPAFKTAGYCIPISSKYLLMGSKYPGRLNILKEVVEQDKNHTRFIVQELHRKGIGKRIGILSLSYLGDIPVDIESPTHYLNEEFNKLGYKVWVHDPYFNQHDLESIGLLPLSYPGMLFEMDCILLIANHNLYVEKPPFEYLREGQIILDNHGGWIDHRDKFKEMGIEYHRIGDPDWLG